MPRLQLKSWEKSSLVSASGRGKSIVHQQDEMCRVLLCRRRNRQNFGKVKKRLFSITRFTRYWMFSLPH